ncbi:hypothetical protein [Ectopseudomonas mendocina]|uniref:hypothetical protein n=1 Tax=Ectopseudomonas mendocina TaxID=300 RepID=UPI003F10237F
MGVDLADWEEVTWKVSARTFSLVGRNNVSQPTVSFLSSDLALGLVGKEWDSVIKACVVLRQQRRPKSITSHRTFIRTVGFIVCAAKGRAVAELTPEILDAACHDIQHSTQSDKQAYKMQGYVSEFARQWCFRYGLCRADLSKYEFHARQRPLDYGGQSRIRLDSPKATEIDSQRLVKSRSFALIGELYQKVPKEHIYRTYILIIVLLFCLGRRFSEIVMLPRDCLEDHSDGLYLKYIAMKSGGVSEPYQYKSVPVLSLVSELVRDVVAELKASSEGQYSCASHMCRCNGPDLRFLDEVDNSRSLQLKDLVALGFPKSCLGTFGWFNKHNLLRRLPKERGRQCAAYIFKKDAAQFCLSHFRPSMIKPVLVVKGEVFTLNDLLILRWLGTSSGFYARWLVQPVSHSMFSTFMRGFDSLAAKFCSSEFDQRFTSHDFRHTLNDALDRGGFPELMQAEYFGRKCAKDTKAYQHSSPEYRALQLREKIKLGQVGGAIAERVMNLPVDKQDIYLESEVRSVHDLGLGICLHVWSHGPCSRHLECCNGCGKFSWLKGADGESQYEQVMEAKRQISSNLLVLCNAFDYAKERVGGIEQWVKHLFVKIKTLKQLLADLDPNEANFEEFGAFWANNMASPDNLDRVRIDIAHNYYKKNHERYLALVVVDHA